MNETHVINYVSSSKISLSQFFGNETPFAGLKRKVNNVCKFVVWML